MQDPAVGSAELFHSANKAEADQALHHQRRQYTLGRAVQLAEKEKLYPSPIQADLNDFFQKRNWLVHHVLVEFSEGGFPIGPTDSVSEVESLYQPSTGTPKGHRNGYDPI